MNQSEISFSTSSVKNSLVSGFDEFDHEGHRIVESGFTDHDHDSWKIVMEKFHSMWGPNLKRSMKRYDIIVAMQVIFGRC